MSTSAVVFPIGDDRYAVDAAMVREVVADASPTPLPTAPAVFAGVFNLRGEVVPIFDTAALLGIGRSTACAMTVVVNTVFGPAGLWVGGLPSVTVLEEPVGPSELRATLGVYASSGQMVVLIDVEALLLPHTNLAATNLCDGLVDR